jgi:carbon-monoxide dehydrogenase large subunit
MGVHEDARDWALQKFGVGQPVRRSEDPVLLRGEGRYTDDVDLAGQAHAVVVRSPYAHGVIRRIGTEAARAMPGVLGVYTAEDLADYGTLKCVIGFDNRDGTPMRKPPRPALARDKVRFVGDPVAVVVAETAALAEDALEAIAAEALKRATGARALRTIIEEVMLDIMYEIPSRRDVKKVIVTAETILFRKEPAIITLNQLKTAS